MPVIQYTRPPAINAYTRQREFIDDPTRYIIIEGATKTGKTVGAIVWLFEKALKGKPGANFWWVSPISSTARIAFDRLKRYLIPCSDIYVANETRMTIYIPLLEVTICFKSADNPDSLYGDDVHACVFDEATRAEEAAWLAILTTTTATGGPVRILNNTKGTSNWVFQLILKINEKKLPEFEWKHYKLTCDDAVQAGLLTVEEIESKRRIMPAGMFLELYYCIPNESSSDKFCFSFSKEKHIGKVTWDKSLYTYLSFDFNRNPICCSVIQHKPAERWAGVVACIKLENSNIYRLLDVIIARFPGAAFIVCGDASGANKSAMVEDDRDYFIIIKNKLRLGVGAMQQTTSNPKIKDNQVLVNAVFEHYNITIDADNAAALIFDCEFVKVDAVGEIVKINKSDRNNPTMQADALDTWRYWCNRYLRNHFKA